MAEPVNAPWPCAVTLAQVDRGGVAVVLEPGPEDRQAIARTLGLVSLESLHAEVFLTPWIAGAEISGLVRARVVQVCGATADEFEEPIEARFKVRVIPADSEHAPQDEGGELAVDLESDDPPDILDGHTIDVSAYVVEHLALELDPFPRKPGAVFEAPAEPVELSPFAALKALRPRDEEG